MAPSDLSGRSAQCEDELRRRLAAAAAPGAWRVRCFDAAASTMDLARELLPEASPAETLLTVALHQHGGRGRRGRRWQPAGRGLYMTAAFCAAQPPADLPAFSLAAGCVVQSYLAASGCPAGLKWPNDVWSLDRRKLAGILIEAAPHGGRTWVLTGIGLNLKDAPAGVGAAAAAVYDICAREAAVPEAAAAIAAGLLTAWREFSARGFSAFRERWLAAALMIGESVRVETGGEAIQGRMVGVTETGRLRLEVDGAVRDIVSGDLMEAA